MNDTRHRIMSAARSTVQDRGYNGLSFQNLAEEVGIKSASIHYYFPSKGDLGGAVAHEYSSGFAEYLDGLLAVSLGQDACIRKYTDILRASLLSENRMCLCGIIGAENEEWPIAVKAEAVKFSEMNVRWLEKVLSLETDVADTVEAIHSRALAIFAAIEGAQLVARSRGDVAIYDEIIGAYRKTGMLP